MRLHPLFILSDLEAGGAQRVILTVIRHINRRFFDPHLALINKNGPLVREIPEDVHIHDLKISRVRYAIPGILRLCRSIRPETVVSTLGHLNLSLLAVKSFFPRHTDLVVREANTPSIRLQHTRHPSLYRLLYRVLYPQADRVICNSQYMKRDMAGFISLPPERAVVIPNPVDSERIDRLILNGEKPYRNGNCHIVSIGRLNYQKGFDLLLKAFKKALQRIPWIHITLVGDGPERGPLKKIATDLGIMDAVNFAGHQDNPFPFMAHADFLISSSRWEGLPNVILEALACRTPVLAFDCPGGTGEIIRHGKNGWLVPPGDVEAMAGKILDIVKGKIRTSLREKDFLPHEYHLGNVVRMFEDLLTQVMEK